MTRSYRWAMTVLIVVALICLVFAFSLVVNAIRDQPFRWFDALYFVIALVWTVRLLGNLMWLRREGDPRRR